MRCECHVDVNRGGLAENGRRGYTGAVRKFNYGDSIPLEAERAVKTVGRRECTRLQAVDSGRLDSVGRDASARDRFLFSASGFRGTERMQIFVFPKRRIAFTTFPFRSRFDLSVRNGNALAKSLSVES